MARRNEVVFLVDHPVEVDGSEIRDDKYKEYKEAWLKGRISEVPDDQRQGKKLYNVKLEKDNKTVRVGLNGIRPPQAVSNGPTFRQGKVVEYLKEGVWRKVKLMRAINPGGSSYEIQILYSNDLDLEIVSRNVLREQKEWIHSRDAWE